MQLPSSEYNYTADLVAVTSTAPLEMAAVQSISVLAVAAEGAARYWPSFSQEGNYTETDVDLGDLCNFVVAVRVSRFLQLKIDGFANQFVRKKNSPLTLPNPKYSRVPKYNHIKQYHSRNH